MDRLVSPPITLTPRQAQRRVRRADVVFHDVPARGASYVAKVFLDPQGKEPDISPTREAGYAGFFCIFGHGGCSGDEGHWEPPTERDPFDLGLPHALTPQVKRVDVTTQLTTMTAETIFGTVVPVSRSANGPLLIGALEFSRLRPLGYD